MLQMQINIYLRQWKGLKIISLSSLDLIKDLLPEWKKKSLWKQKAIKNLCLEVVW